MSKLIECKVCSKEIAKGAKSCPNCGSKNKKPLYKKTWFIVVSALIVFGAIGGDGDDSSANISSITTETVYEENQNTSTEQETKVEENIPTEYKSALKKAESYNKLMNMSKEGLYNQLTSEYADKFSQEAAQYAIDNLDADWKENALKKAESYSDTMNMSKKGIYDQLVSEYGEKFTSEEAQYAIDNLEADWKENALKKAESYQETMSMSPSAIYDQLVSEYGEKFTSEEAQYAIDNLE